MLPNHHEELPDPTAPPPNYSTLPPTEPPPAQPQLPPREHQQQQQHSVIPMAANPAWGRPTFRRLSVRHKEFQVGFGGLFFSALLFIVGYSSPAWFNNTGLWMTCSFSCYSNVGGGPAWFDATRSMETFALVCFLLCLAMALYEEVFKSPPPKETKAVEILAALAAFFGLIGIVVFAASTPRRRLTDYIYNQEDYSYTYIYTYLYLNWAFGLATAGIILVVICAILIAHSRVIHGAQTQHSGAQARVMPPDHPHLSSQPMTPPYTLPSYPAQSLPTPPMGYPPLMVPYPHFYPCPCPYPLPAATTLTAPSMYAPSTAASPAAAPAAAQSTSAGADPKDQGPSTSTLQSGAEGGSAPTPQMPIFFVMTQGRPLPVYDHLSSEAETSSTAH